jgi:hypothetical protein
MTFHVARASTSERRSAALRDGSGGASEPTILSPLHAHIPTNSSARIPCAATVSLRDHISTSLNVSKRGTLLARLATARRCGKPKK